MHREIRNLRFRIDRDQPCLDEARAVIDAYDHRSRGAFYLTPEGEVSLNAIHRLRAARQLSIDIPGAVTSLYKAIDELLEPLTPKLSPTGADAFAYGVAAAKLTDADADRAVENYRNAHPEISGMWVDEADTIPVKTIERMLGDPRPAKPDPMIRRIASIIVPGYDNDGVQLYPELRAIRLELASLFGQVTAWEGAMMLRDSRAMTQCECTRFDVEIVDAPGENDLRRVAARAARSFRQPDGIAIRLPDGSTYRIDAEGVAR